MNVRLDGSTHVHPLAAWDGTSIGNQRANHEHCTAGHADKHTEPLKVASRAKAERDRMAMRDDRIKVQCNSDERIVTTALNVKHAHTVVR